MPKDPRIAEVCPSRTAATLHSVNKRTNVTARIEQREREARGGDCSAFRKRKRSFHARLSLGDRAERVPWNNGFSPINRRSRKEDFGELNRARANVKSGDEARDRPRYLVPLTSRSGFTWPLALCLPAPPHRSYLSCASRSISSMMPPRTLARDRLESSGTNEGTFRNND